MNVNNMFWSFFTMLLILGTQAQSQLSITKTAPHPQSSVSLSIVPSVHPPLPIATLINKTSPTITRPMTLSASIFREEGALYWFADGMLKDENFIPEFFDVDLQRQNMTFKAKLVFAEFDFFATQDPERAFDFLNVSLRDAVRVQKRGLLFRVEQGAVLTPDSLEFTLDTVTIRFLMDDFFQLDGDELVAITFSRNITFNQKRIRNELFLRIRSFKYPKNLVLTGFLGFVSSALAIATISIGMPGLHQLQMVAQIGAMSCTTKEVRSFTDGAEFFLSPLPIEEAPTGRLGAIMAICAYCFLWHILAVRLIKNKIQGIGTMEVMSRTGFPSIPYAVAIIGFPGFVYFCVAFLYQIVNGGVMVVIAAAALVCAVALGVGVALMYGSDTFLERRWLAEPNYGFGGLRSKLLEPSGYWGPTNILSMYRAVIWPYTPVSEKFMISVFVETLIVGIVTGFQPSSRFQCRGQYGLLSLFFLLSMLFYGLRQPYRYNVETILTLLTLISLLVMTVAATFDNETVRSAYVAGVSLAIIFGFVRVCFCIFVFLRERNRSFHNVLEQTPVVRYADPPRAVPMQDVQSEGSSSEEDAHKKSPQAPRSQKEMVPQRARPPTAQDSASTPDRYTSTALPFGRPSQAVVQNGTPPAAAAPPMRGTKSAKAAGKAPAIPGRGKKMNGKVPGGTPTTTSAPSAPQRVNTKKRPAQPSAAPQAATTAVNDLDEVL